MNEKFQKLFGPNPSREEPALSPAPFDTQADEDREYKRSMARVRNKRRVLGFAMLAVGAAVVLPWIIDPNPQYAQRTALTDIPLIKTKPSSVSVSVKEEPTVAKKAQTSSGFTQTQTSASKPVEPKKTVSEPKAKPVVQKPTEPAAVKPAAKPSEPVKTAKTSAPAGKPANAPIVADKQGAYVIQVVATGSHTGAVRTQKKLEALGLPVYLERVRRQNTDLWRVRVGRFATQEKAKEAVDRLTKNGVTHGGILTEKVQ